MTVKTPEPDKWKKIGPFSGKAYAEMAGEILDQQSIPFYISQDGVSNAYGIHGTSIVGNTAFIFVPEDFFELASELLTGFLEEN